MKVLATTGALTLAAVWAALAVNFDQVVMGTAGIAFLISLIFIWDLN